MQCMPLMLVTVMLGLISAHRLDSYRRKPFVGTAGGEPFRAPAKDFNVLGGGSSFREQAANGASTNMQQLQRFYGNRNDLLQNLLAMSECGPGGELPALVPPPKDNVDLMEVVRDNVDNERDIFTSSSRNAEALNDARGAALDNDAVPLADGGDWEGGGGMLSKLPIAYYTDFYEDLMIDSGKEEVKRAGPMPIIGCDCKIKNDLVDLGQQHFPRYLLNAVCQTDQSPNEYPQKCWRGSHCKPLEYKVKVLTFRTVMDHGQKDPALAWLPDDLRQLWKFKTVTVAAGCFCSY